MGELFLTIIKILASLSALYMCLSPTTSMYRIHKQRNTGQMSVIPLVALWGCNHTWLLYGYVTDDLFPLMVTYIFGDVTSVVFILTYLRWSNERMFSFKASMIVLVINAMVTVYAVLGMKGYTGQAVHDVQLVVGIIAIASSVLLYASPFATIANVIKTKSSSSIPFTMVVVGITNNVLWTIYGFLIQDPLMIIPTVFNMCIGVFQFVLYFFYHPKRQKLGTSTLDSVVVVSDAQISKPVAAIIPVDASVIAPHLEQIACSLPLDVPNADEVALTSIEVVEGNAVSHFVQLQSPAAGLR